MKKVIILLFALITFTITSCGYSKEDVARARSEGYEAGYEDGYDEARYYAKAELEQAINECSYDAYEHGYEAGYQDCLDEHGLDTATSRIEKDH